MSKVALTLGALGTTAGVAGLVVGLTALMRPDLSALAPPTTTSVAAPSEHDVRAASAAACAGFENFKSGVGIARGAFIDRVDRASDWDSPESLGVQGYYFGAVGLELAYLDKRVGPDTPASIVSAIADLQRSFTAVVDADLRREPASVSNLAVEDYSESLAAVESGCKAAGVG